MKLWGFLFPALLTATISASGQMKADSSFSLLFNGGVSFTHANDPHINRWLEKYGYPPEPHVPSSINFEVAAIPAYSRLLYSIKLSTINSGNNLSSYNISAGLYTALIKSQRFLLFVGGSVGLHGDIITLNGQLPPDYEQLATEYHAPLALRRRGLFVEPAARAFWYPLRFSSVQIGLYGALGYDLDINSKWKLGYYSNNHGKYSHFRELGKPSDQDKVSEYGVFYSVGFSLRVHLH
ncbi:MAG TPA: hypothetical protein VNU70_10265 [Puia sp.]|jgi:hypothetical protein|nr:hypothetical protein [Puia sp.]